MTGSERAGKRRRNGQLRAALVASAAICAICPAVSAHAAEGDGGAGTGAGQAVQLDDVVVTARRRSERLLDVPVAATAITAQEARRYDLTTIANIKILAPQISFDRVGTGSGASIAMRGVSSSSLDAGLEQSVLLDYDGMPLSRARILTDALFDIEGIDVLKGPQSLFFGKNTPGGVVSIRTAGPTSDLEAYVRTGYEFTKRSPSVEAAVSGPLGGGFGFRLAAYGNQSQGYIHNNDLGGVPDPFRIARLPVDTGGVFDPAAPSRLGAEDKYGLRLTLAYDNGGAFNASFKLLGTYSRGQGHGSFSEVMSCPGGATHPRSTGIADPMGDCELNNQVSTGYLPPAIAANWPAIKGWADAGPSGRNISYLPTLTMNYKVGSVTLTSVTGFYNYNYRSGGSADATAYNYFWSYQIEKNSNFMQEVRAVTGFDGPLNFAAGGYYEHNQRTLLAGAENGPNPVDPATGRYCTNDNRTDNKDHAWSVFGQLTYKILPSLELAGGARYTDQTKQVAIQTLYVNPAVAAAYLIPHTPLSGTHSENHVSPEATLTWHAQPNVMFYAAYKTGYLSGGFSNPGTPVRTLTLPLISYNAERAKGYEVGTKVSILDRRLTGSLVGYHYIYNGLQLTSLNVSLPTPTYQTTNAADTLIQGIELQGSFRVVSGLSLNGSISYNDARFQEFKNAQCYAGQTAATGCLPHTVNATTVNAQDLSGHDVYRSPDWLVTAGFTYDFQVGDNLKVGLNGDIRSSSGYFVGVSNNPGGWQKGYVLFNAGVRFAPLDDHWTVALIGRNLTNEIYGAIGTDKPGGTGEVFGVTGEPRAVVLQLETRF